MRLVARMLVLMSIASAAAVLTATPGEGQDPFAAMFTPEAPADGRVDRLKREAADEVERSREFTQQMVDRLFSFGEIGFQEVESSRYLTSVLEKNGFRVERGISGIPTAWIATWGAGKPVIAIGADLDGIPQASQKPGVAYHDPLVEGAPGHGEGHNAGQAVNITAVLAVKRLMERERLPGTIKVWPGIAEELVGSKAWFVRDGYFRDVDVAMFSHVDAAMQPENWGEDSGNGMVSVEYTFTGQSASAAVTPWRGRSALDAVELMDVGWNFRREHLRLQQRSHSVITNGGDQPDVVPQTASVWYYFRENDEDRIRALWSVGNDMARGAALMTGTTASWRVLGAAWPIHMSSPLSDVMERNVTAVGVPEWSGADQALARALQREVGVPPEGLSTTLPAPGGPIPPDERRGGGSDDIGDISWNVPTVSLRFPANIPNLPGHHWANAVAMATPIAHKGATAGAKVQAMTMLDVLLRPEVVRDAWTYFRDVQTRDRTYVSFITAADTPAIWLNATTAAKYRHDMEKFYFDPARYRTYLDQLRITYPTLRAGVTTAGGH